MPAATDHAPPQSAARVAGFMFLLAFIVPTLSWVFLLLTLVVSGDIVATAENILANELRFRIGMTIELGMAVGLVVLSLALSSILEAVDRALTPSFAVRGAIVENSRSHFGAANTLSTSSSRQDPADRGSLGGRTGPPGGCYDVACED